MSTTRAASETTTHPIPMAVQQVLDLFATELADVRFPRLDHEILEALAGEVRAANERLEEARRVVEEARAALTQRQDGLLERARQGVAYARVFAEGDQALGARIEGLSLAQVSKPAKRKTRRRRKTEPDLSAELPLATPAPIIQLEAV